MRRLAIEAAWAIFISLVWLLAGVRTINANASVPHDECVATFSELWFGVHIHVHSSYPSSRTYYGKNDPILRYLADNGCFCAGQLGYAYVSSRLYPSPFVLSSFLTSILLNSESMVLHNHHTWLKERPFE